MNTALRNLFRTLLLGVALLVGLPEASAQVAFLAPSSTTVTKDTRASVFGYVKNASQVSSGQSATDLEAHRRWALGQTDAVLAQEIDRLVNVVMGNLRKLTKDKLVEVFAQLKHGALLAANKASGHSLSSHRGWAGGQTDATLRGEIVRMALAGSQSF